MTAPASTLRSAASRLRALAEAATRGEWEDGPDYGDWRRIRSESSTASQYIAQIRNPADAALIAALGPTFALAVAALLDDLAEDSEMQAPRGPLHAQWDMRVHIAVQAALAVAAALESPRPVTSTAHTADPTRG